MTAALACLVGAGIAAPHLLRLELAHPATAAAIWLAAVCLRALVAIFLAVLAVFYLPTTAVFQLATHWCWHAAVPVLTTHLGLSGHSVGDLALILPALGLSLSLLSVCVGLWRAARIIRGWVHRTSIGPGPQRSVVVGERDVLVAAAGLRRPLVIVSAGALTTFDDEELAASLAHERGHIEHRHRFVLLFAEVCRSLARFVPGTRRAVDELVFQLERDADRWAVQRRHEPTALASAICKAARRPVHGGGALMTLSGRGVACRVRQLLAPHVPRKRDRRLDALAAGMVALVLVTSAAVPTATFAGMAHAARAEAPPRHCPD